MVMWKFRVFYVIFLRLEFNCIYIVELFAINCGPGLHMRCGVACPSWSQLSKESLVVPTLA